MAYLNHHSESEHSALVLKVVPVKLSGDQSTMTRISVIPEGHLEELIFTSALMSSLIIFWTSRVSLRRPFSTVRDRSLRARSGSE